MFHMIRDFLLLLVSDRNHSDLGVSIAMEPAAVTIESVNATRGLTPHAGAKTADECGELAQGLSQFPDRMVRIVHDLGRILREVVAESGQRVLQRLQFKQANAPSA